MRQYEKRIIAVFLSACSAEKAYEWMASNAKDKHGRSVLEYLLLRRKNPLIDLGLAQFGCELSVLRKVFGRGGAGVRCAVLANPTLGDDFQEAVDLEAVAKRGNRRELEALALNPHLRDSVYLNLLNREGQFLEICDRNYQFMLFCFGDNPRLALPYDDTFLDGLGEYLHNEVFTAAWELTAVVPASEEWAKVLVNLLRKAQRPVGLRDVPKIIERWKDENSYHFCLRSRLADLLKADDDLLGATDPALRYSFYRRFSPYKYKNWPDFTDKDGKHFIQEAMHNNELWKSAAERDRLSKLAWDAPDPTSSMMMPNVFRAREKTLRAEHPEWFDA